MAPIYVLKLHQGPLGGASAHWGILVPLPHSIYDDWGTPDSGTFFHARKNMGTCFNLLSESQTQWERREVYLSQLPSLADCRLLNDTNVEAEQVNVAYTVISDNRQFNWVMQNCQNWVIEVLKNLGLPEAVFQQMTRLGYVPLGDTSCVKCARSSLSLNCSCRRQRR